MDKNEYYKCYKCDFGTIICDITGPQHGMPPKYSYTCTDCGEKCVKLCYEDFLEATYEKVLIIEDI